MIKQLLQVFKQAFFVDPDLKGIHYRDAEYEMSMFIFNVVSVTVVAMCLLYFYKIFFNHS